MWSSAANVARRVISVFGLVAFSALALASPGQVSLSERAIWLKLRPSILLLTETTVSSPTHNRNLIVKQNRVLGSAVCIDASGLFVAHQNSIHGQVQTAVRSDGSTLNLYLVGTDATSDLVLLQTTPPRQTYAMNQAAPTLLGATRAAQGLGGAPGGGGGFGGGAGFGGGQQTKPPSSQADSNPKGGQIPPVTTTQSNRQADGEATARQAGPQTTAGATTSTVTASNNVGMFFGLKLANSANQNWVPVEVAKEVPKGGTLLAVLPNGPARAEVTNADIVASGKTNHQIVAVNKIHFDAPVQMLAGALLFDVQGRLVGVLGAISVATTTSNSQTVLGNGRVVTDTRATTLDQNTYTAVSNNRLSNFGPPGLQEAFALSPIILSRVVSGFRSADHMVKHPALGATCADALNSSGVSVGALVQQIAPDSSAARAGLEEGDIIVLIDGAIVNNPIDYVWNLLNKEVGQSVRVTIRRGDSVLELKAIIGSAAPTPVSQPAQRKLSIPHPSP